MSTSSITIRSIIVEGGRSVEPPTGRRWWRSRRSRKRRRRTTTKTNNNDSNCELSTNTTLSCLFENIRPVAGLSRFEPARLPEREAAFWTAGLGSVRFGSVRLRRMNLQLRGQTTPVMAAALGSVYISDVTTSSGPDWLGSRRCCFHGSGIKLRGKRTTGGEEQEEEEVQEVFYVCGS